MIKRYISKVLLGNEDGCDTFEAELTGVEHLYREDAQNEIERYEPIIAGMHVWIEEIER